MTKDSTVAPDTPSKKSKIVLGQIDLSFHKASAAVFHNVLNHLNYTVDVVTAPHEEIFLQQGKGEIDLLISAWLPGSHGKYFSPYEGDACKLSPIYEPYCIWGVPSYIPQEAVTKIQDLNHPAILPKMLKTIDGIGMGAGISRFSIEIIEAYGLNTNGYHFVSNNPSTFFSLTEQRIKSKEWFIIPLWHPQYLSHMFELRPLEEAKGLLRGKDEATPILLRNAKRKFLPNDLDVLSKITLGNAHVEALDFKINKENKAPYEAASEWIEENYGSIGQWIELLLAK